MTRLSIIHKTAYKYNKRVTLSYNEARMTPLTDPQQVVLESSMKVSPSQAAVSSFRDYWGTRVTAFDMQMPHEYLEVLSTTTVEVLSTRDVLSAGMSWVNMLRCAGAYESFLRTRRAAFGDQHAAEFLLLDRLFPRSIVYALRDADECLAKLDPSAQRVGFINDARRIVGQARTFLEFHRTDDLMSELPEHMERVQKAVSQASDAISRKYFNQADELAWVGEVS